MADEFRHYTMKGRRLGVTTQLKRDLEARMATMQPGQRIVIERADGETMTITRLEGKNPDAPNRNG